MTNIIETSLNSCYYKYIFLSYNISKIGQSPSPCLILNTSTIKSVISFLEIQTHLSGILVILKCWAESKQQ